MDVILLDVWTPEVKIFFFFFCYFYVRTTILSLCGFAQAKTKIYFPISVGHTAISMNIF